MQFTPLSKMLQSKVKVPDTKLNLANYTNFTYINLLHFLRVA